MLLPMYFLIGVWGGPRREYAAIKFFLYTMLGSVFILIAMLGFYFTDVRDFATPAQKLDAAARKQCREAWARWWKQHGQAVDLAKLRERPRPDRDVVRIASPRKCPPRHVSAITLAPGSRC